MNHAACASDRFEPTLTDAAGGMNDRSTEIGIYAIIKLG
ncbi:hypothetical protein FHS72_003054 [Loktanella ponticola]|uniref:Uncharacterized protein n=1 Tax=Yoonia ponticola TaxID=1524255 RepID=A0A7W9BMT9_9RHOB|nr:hypothetical protein [Yoonia ponticola]